MDRLAPSAGGLVGSEVRQRRWGAELAGFLCRPAVFVGLVCLTVGALWVLIIGLSASCSVVRGRKPGRIPMINSDCRPSLEVA